MLLLANASLTNTLRTDVSYESLLHSEFYANHPYITKTFDDNISHHPSLIPGLTISKDSLINPTDKNSKVNCLIKEAIKNAAAVVAWSFMCMLALSSVLGNNIASAYQGQGSLALNGTKVTLATLWTTPSNVVGIFRPNHFINFSNAITSCNKQD